MITNYKINQPFTSNYSVEEEEENSSRTWNHGAGRIVNHVETFFYAEARKVSGRKTIQSQHCESQFVPGWTDFFLVLFKEIIRDKVFKLANEALNPSLKDLARQELISFTKHKRPISSEDLEVLYAANKLGLNPPERFENSAWKERPWKPTRNPVTFSSKQQACWSISSQARERRKLSPPSSAPDFTRSVFHGCKFWDWNTFLCCQVFEQYVRMYEPKAQSLRVFDPRGVTRINFT